MLHVAHLASGLKGWGGIQRMLFDFFLHTHSSDLHHYLISTSISSDLEKWLEQENIAWFRPSRFKYHPARLLDIVEYLRSRDIKIIHSYSAYSNIWAYVAMQLIKSPPVLLTGEHGSIWFIPPPLRWMDCFVQRRAQLVIANSKAAAFMLQSYYRIPSDRIRVVYNAVLQPRLISNKEARQRLGVPDDCEIIGSVGRLDTPKDYWTLIDAAKIVLKYKPTAHFVVIGDGPQYSFLAHLVQESGIADRFHLLGMRDDARDLIAAFDLFVSTSFREPFGNVLLEAAFANKAVIAPAVDGIPEVVESNQTGILLSPTLPVRPVAVPGSSPMPKFVVRDGKLQPPRSLDPQLLAETIVDLLDDPERRKWMGENGRRRAEAFFTMARYVDELERIYLEFDK